jgi:hypothetical protein
MRRSTPDREPSWPTVADAFVLADALAGLADDRHVPQ